jgi:hypothetical protein
VIFPKKLYFGLRLLIFLNRDPGLSILLSRYHRTPDIFIKVCAKYHVNACIPATKWSSVMEIKALGERRYSSYSFSTSAAFCSGERTPGTLCTGGWVGPRAGLDTEARGKKSFRLCRGSNLDRPVIQPDTILTELTRIRLKCLTYV